ncbi:MAG: cytidine deaminase [Muribaculaceae bacterium]|nr:cytidine deaminase [Muribaculaceae bacterium]
MQELQLSIPYKKLSYDELDGRRQRLVDLARQYTHNAYAPYSHFHVGAAIALDNGEVVCGANQENAAFPSGTCAERSACFSAGARFPEAKFEIIAIAARGTDGNELRMPVAPCGACRQALLEYEGRAGHDVEVLLVGSEAIFALESVQSLLPFAFTELG